MSSVNTGGESTQTASGTLTILRAHVVATEEPAEDSSEPVHRLMVRLHARLDGRALRGEGWGRLPEGMPPAERRAVWRWLVETVRGLRTRTRTLAVERSGAAQLASDDEGRPSSAETGHAVVGETVLAAAEDLLRQAAGGQANPSEYVDRLHLIRRRAWTPRLAEARDPDGRKVNVFDEEIDLAGSPLSYSSYLLQQAALARGLSTVRFSRGDFTAWDAQGTEMTFWRSLADTESPVSEFLCDHKQLTRRLLEAADVPTASGEVFGPEETDQAVAFADSIGYPVVVKPQIGRKGHGVVTGIGDAAELRSALDELAGMRRRTEQVIVEKHLLGQDYRIYVAFGEVVSVVLRRPAAVVGDGVRSVAELAAAKNALRLRSTHTRTRLIRADGAARTMLRRQGLSWDSVVDEGAEVLLASAANISQGGDSVEVIDETHPSLLEAARRAVAAVPGLRQAGVDFLMPDHTREVAGQGGGVCEINALAALMASRAPLFGAAQPVAQRVVDLAARHHGLTLDAAEGQELTVEVTAEDLGDPRVLARWAENTARRRGVEAEVIEIRTGDDAAVRLRLHGTAPKIMRLVSGMMIGPARRRPAALYVVQGPQTQPRQSSAPHHEATATHQEARA